MTPLVLVHGFLGGSRQWHLQAPLAQDRDVIPLDLPGFGLNAHMPPAQSIRGFAEWALDSLSEKGITEFDLLGHSMGGMVVQEMMHLAHSRIRRLVLYCTGAIGAMPGRFEPIATSMKRAEAEGAEITARQMSEKWFMAGANAPEYAGCLDIALKARLPAILAGFGAMQGWNGEAYLSEISARTLVLWADSDRAYPWPQTERLWRGIPDARLAVVPACGHAVHLEKPGLFNALVDEFLTG